MDTFYARLSCPACLKNTEGEQELLTDLDKLLMASKASEVECVMLYINMKELTTSTWKILIQKKNFHIWYIGMLTTLYEQCQRNCLWMVSNEEKTCLGLIKNL